MRPKLHENTEIQTSDLRVALISGNYNMVRDGPTQALNRLVAYLLDRGAKVRVYSPTVENPAIEATGDLVSLPSLAIPGRSEYRIPLGMPLRIRRNLEAFRPNLIHVASPDPSTHGALRWAKKQGIPVLGSVHTRFDTYPRYYHMGWIEPLLTTALRRFYRRCGMLVAPSQSMVDLLRQQGMNANIGIWTRGVDRNLFDKEQRDLAWRRTMGIDDKTMVIGFLGRLVLEKGLDVFAETVAELKRRSILHKVLIVGEGPAREWLEKQIPEAAFAGFLQGNELGRAIASMDVLLNPSVTETFGNVTLEAMACSVPVVAAAATGSESLISDDVTGKLVAAGDIVGFANALQNYAEFPNLRREHGSSAERRSRHYCWDEINENMAKTYIELVSLREQSNSVGKREQPKRKMPTGISEKPEERQGFQLEQL